MLKTKTVGAKATPVGIEVSFEGEQAPKEPQVYDLVLVAVGRSPNGKRIGADKAGVAVTDRGFIEVDRQMRTNVPHIFAIGDIVGQPMLAHKAVHEAHVAAEVAHGEQGVLRRAPDSVGGLHRPRGRVGRQDRGGVQGRRASKYGKAVFPWAASGRAIANGRDEGFTKLIFDEATHRVIGGGIVGTHAGDLISEVCLAVEMGCEPADIGKTIHPHPTLGESIGMCAEVFEGVCTDLPPQKKNDDAAGRARIELNHRSNRRPTHGGRTSKTRPSSTTACPRRARSRSCRPRRWPRSATWRWPIRRASRRPAWPSPTIRSRPTN